MNLSEWGTRHSKKIFFGIVVIAALVVAYLDYANHPVSNRAKAGTSTHQKPSVDLLPPIDLEKEHWRVTAEKELMEMRKNQEELTKKIEELSGRRKEAEVRSIPMVPFHAPHAPPIFNTPPEPSSSNLPSFPGSAPVAPAEPPIHTFSPEARIPIGQTTPPPTGRNASASPKEEKPYLPSGSFVRGILLSGLDAPAGARSSQEPHPVLIRLEEQAVLPNRFRFDIKECFIIGEGYGDLSSERAYVRTTALSCVRPDGTSIDAPLKGFVAGEDGKVGLRGRVVSKEGQLLAKAMVAGFAEGIAKILSVSMTTVSVSPLGSTQSIEPGKALQAGVLGGSSHAMERLARYYIDMAERLFPVIEVDAGRSVDVVVLQGRAMAPVE